MAVVGLCLRWIGPVFRTADSAVDVVAGPRRVAVLGAAAVSVLVGLGAGAVLAGVTGG